MQVEQAARVMVLLNLCLVAYPHTLHLSNLSATSILSERFVCRWSGLCGWWCCWCVCTTTA